MIENTHFFKEENKIIHFYSFVLIGFSNKKEILLILFFKFQVNIFKLFNFNFNLIKNNLKSID